MCLYVYDEDPEPAETDPAGLLFVPAQSGSGGCTPRYFPQGTLRAGDPVPEQGLRTALVPSVVPVAHRLRAHPQHARDLRIRPATLFA